MANGPIPISEANDMIQQYLVYMKSLGVDMNKQTQNVGFETPGLWEWMERVKKYTDEFRICLGVYPAGFPDQGRLTVIIWPYKDGNPAVDDSGKSGGGGNGIKPYNQGQLSP